MIWSIYSRAVESTEQREQLISGDIVGCHYWLLNYKTVSQFPTGIYIAPLVCKIGVSAGINWFPPNYRVYTWDNINAHEKGMPHPSLAHIWHTVVPFSVCSCCIFIFDALNGTLTVYFLHLKWSFSILLWFTVTEISWLKLKELLSLCELMKLLINSLWQSQYRAASVLFSQYSKTLGSWPYWLEIGLLSLGALILYRTFDYLECWFHLV